jgi:pyrroline-5-carboxylate reductase
VPVCRVLPLPTIAFGKGPVLCYPNLAPIVALLNGLGVLILPETEAQFDALGGVSGFMSSFFELEAALAAWLAARGVPDPSAARYVGALFGGLPSTTLRAPPRLPALAPEHETPGGVNERTRRALREMGWFDRPGEAISMVRLIARESLK